MVNVGFGEIFIKRRAVFSLAFGVVSWKEEFAEYRSITIDSLSSIAENFYLIIFFRSNILLN